MDDFSSQYYEEVDSPSPDGDSDDEGTGQQKTEAPNNTKAESVPPIELFWHGDKHERALRSWLVADLIPEIGQGLLAGQWGCGKTFAAIDLAASTMTGLPFAGREIARRGGVLFIAAEGESEIPIRLQGVVDYRLRPEALAAAASGNPLNADLDRLPFAWINQAALLADDRSFQLLVDAARSAASHIQDQFELPLTLIIIDTMSASADFKDPNDAGEAQRVMNRLGALSQATGAFVLASDHFGKLSEVGVRGSSAKEASADLVIAMLGDKDTAGNITSLRMTIRKLRAGATGAETPFKLKVVEIGDGDTTCVIDWQTQQQAKPAGSGTKDRWPKSLRIFRSALTTVLVEQGKAAQPFGREGPTVRAVPDSAVRAEFMKAYPADGEDERQRASAKRAAFHRALKAALGGQLVCAREIAGVDHLWFADQQDEHAPCAHSAGGAR